MDIGLGNLTELKAHVLPAALQDDTTYDTLVAQIGRGVAVFMDSYCNRIFARAVGSTFDFQADVRSIYLPRYPVESVASIEQKDTQSAGFYSLDSSVMLNRDDNTGLISFGVSLGGWQSVMRVTYTGGYWFDTTEDNTGVMPSGAAALPYDLKLAWYLQVRRTMELIDKLGTNITQQGGPQFVAQTLGALKLVDAVKDTLDGYIRYAMT